jgi:hypothetical protein
MKSSTGDPVRIGSDSGPTSGSSPLWRSLQLRTVSFFGSCASVQDGRLVDGASTWLQVSIQMCVKVDAAKRSLGCERDSPPGRPRELRDTRREDIG